jgi:hypothetical protein
MELDALVVAVYVCELSSYILSRLVVGSWHMSASYVVGND